MLLKSIYAHLKIYGKSAESVLTRPGGIEIATELT